MVRRVAQLLGGLMLFGVGCAVMVEANVGLDPWTVFAQGLSLQTGLGVGWLTNLIGLAVLLLWVPLRQRPGVGTVANILLVGTAMQIALDVLPPLEGLAARSILFGVGLLLVAVGSGLYIGARFGPGPRDGLMTGLSARFGMPLWAARASVEASVLIAGWLMGGTVGVGTVVFAVAIGPLVHPAVRLFDTGRPRTRSTAAAPAIEREVSAPGTPGGPIRA